MAVYAQSGRSAGGFRSAANKLAARADRAAWRRFFLALFGLTFSLFLALYATALSGSGQYALAAAVAAFSLLLAALVAIRVVPYLARRTTLRHWLEKIEYELTRQGAAYLAMIAVIAVAALNTGNNLLFIILSCLLAGILASGVLSGIVLQDLELKLLLPDTVFAEQPVAARLALDNLKRFFPTFSITISGQAVSNLSRRSRPLPSKSAILTQAVYVPYLPHRSAASQDVKLAFSTRGRYSQESLRVSTQFPFGLLRKTRNIPCAQEVLVLPNVHAGGKIVDVLSLIGNEIEGYFKGRSHDLYAIRDYQQSDPARHVDWKATARVKQLKVREFTREEERRLDIVLDQRVPDSRLQTIAKFEKAVTLCACLAWRLREAGVTMSFITGGFETPASPAGEILFTVLEKLALIEPVVTDGNNLSRLLARSSIPRESFQIVLTFNKRESVPAGLLQSAHFIFIDSL